jgi:methionyl-tRNA synthetase
MRDMTPGRDANFDQERIVRRYQADLANDLGNLLHRVVNMIGRYNEGRIPEPGGMAERERALQTCCLVLVTDALDRVNALAVNDALAKVMDVVGEINRYLEQTEPWKLAKHQSTDDTCRVRVAAILYTAAEALRLCSVLLSPVLPERMAELWRRLGWQPPAALHQALGWGNLQPGTPVGAGPPLFPKVD